MPATISKILSFLASAVFWSACGSEPVTVEIDPAFRLLRNDLPPAAEYKNGQGLFAARNLRRHFDFFSAAEFTPVPRQAGKYTLDQASVELRLDPAARTLEGHAEFLISSTDEIASAAFYLAVAPKTATCQPAGCSVSFNQGLLTLSFSPAISPGQSESLIIEWQDSGVEKIVDFTPEGGGPVLANLIHSDSTFFTFGYHFWPAPKEAAPGNIVFRITYPQDYSLLLSGDFIGEQPAGQELKTSEWQIEWRPSWAVVLVLGRYLKVEDFCGPDKIEIYAIPGTSTDGFPIKPESYRPVLKKVCEYFAGLLGELPVQVLRFAGVDERFTNGYSAPGLIVVPNYTFDDDGSGSFPERDFFLAHEVSHQWWGNSLGISSVADLWIIEGGADYLALAATKELYDTDTVEYLWLWEVEPLVKFFNQGGVDHPLVIPPGADIEYRIPYIKGAWVLRMLEDLVALPPLLSSVYEKYRGGFVTSEDFSTEAKNSSQDDLSWFFEQWFYGTGLLELENSWQEKDGRLELSVRQKRAWSKAPERFFRAPLTVRLTLSGCQAERLVELSGQKDADIFTLELP